MPSHTPRRGLRSAVHRPAPRTVRQWGGAVGTVAPLGVIGAAAVVVSTIVVGWPSTPVVVAAQALLPVVGVACVAAAAWSAARRRTAVAVAGCAVALAVGGLVVPTLTAERVPAWAEGASRLTVFSANLRFSNPMVGVALADALAADADVVVLNEFVAAFDDDLERSGLLDAYPTVVRDRVGDGNLLLTRLPVSWSGVISESGIELPAATVDVGGTEVLVAGVHTQAPHSMGYVDEWRQQVSGVARAVVGRDDVIVAGDFNSSIWNPPFRELLSWGFVDAHDATGDGLARTWGRAAPGSSASVPVIGIDHSLSRGPSLVPLAVRNAAVAGSDHRSIRVTYAVS